jgi:ribosomal protein L12E/L44/L45/RPP1/RPP2
MAATDRLDAFGKVIGIIDPAEEGTSFALPASDDQKKLRALIERRHPEYVEQKDHWDFCEETYEGGREWFDANIFRYMKEGDREFKERKSRAYRFNHTREVVDLLNKYLFRQAITRNDTDAPDCVKQFWKRSTRNGLGIDDLSRQVSKMSSIFGRIAIVVDNNMPEGSLSIADAKKLNAGCYAYIVRPQEILDYSFDDRGELNWILLQECYRDDSDPFAGQADVQQRWRLWTKTNWVLVQEYDYGKSRKRLKITGSGQHNLGRVPVILHDNVVSDEEWEAQSLIDDIAYLDRAVANYLSNLDAIIQDQTFSQLAMPAQGMMPGEDNYNKMVEVGTRRIFLYDAEGGQPPTYISPDVKQAQIIVQTIQKIINEIYHTVGLAGERTKEDNAVGIDNSSGVAKAYDFDRVNSLLAAKADSLQTTENKIVKLVALWNSENAEDAELVTYPDDFDTRSLYDEFDIAGHLLLIEAPDEVRREQMAQVIEKLFPQAPKAKADLLNSSLDDWPLQPVIAPPGQLTGTAKQPAANPRNTTGTPNPKTSRQGQVTATTK